MHEQLKGRVQDAEHDVISQPDDKTPARPIAAAQHEYSAKYRQQPDKTDPEKVIIKRMIGFELGGVVCESDNASGYEDPADDCDGARTFTHAILPCRTERTGQHEGVTFRVTGFFCVSQ